MSEVADKECARYVIAFAVGHEQGIQLADKLVFNVFKAPHDVVLGDDHVIEHLDRVFAQLVVVTETEIDDVADQRVQSSLVVLPRREPRSHSNCASTTTHRIPGHGNLFRRGLVWPSHCAP